MYYLRIEESLYELLSKLEESYFFEISLNKVSTTKDLIRFLHRYITFNGDFAAGISNLAGAFHIRQDLFRDSQEEIQVCADRSAEIASHIFFGAEDEYFDKKTQDRITHRRLSQVFFKQVLIYYSIDLSQFDSMYPLSTEAINAFDKVREFYGLNRNNSEREIFVGLGFYIGAELLADKENLTIDKYFTINQPDLVIYLKSKTIDAYGRDAYHYVLTHNEIEKGHFDHALIAARKALEFYSGQYSKDNIEEMILEGFQRFLDLQQHFFENIFNE